VQVTIDVSDDLFKRLTIAAHNNNLTFLQVITAILESSVAGDKIKRKHIRENDLPTVEFY